MSKTLRRKKSAKHKILDWSDILVNEEMDKVDGICIGYYKNPCTVNLGSVLNPQVTTMYVRVFQFVPKTKKEYWEPYSSEHKLSWADSFSRHDPGELKPLNQEYLNKFLDDEEFIIMWNSDLKIGQPIKENYLKGKLIT